MFSAGWHHYSVTETVKTRRRSPGRVRRSLDLVKSNKDLISSGIVPGTLRPLSRRYNKPFLPTPRTYIVEDLVNFRWISCFSLLPTFSMSISISCHFNPGSNRNKASKNHHWTSDLFTVSIHVIAGAFVHANRVNAAKNGKVEDGSWILSWPRISLQHGRSLSMQPWARLRTLSKCLPCFALPKLVHDLQHGQRSYFLFPQFLHPVDCSRPSGPA